MLKRSHSHPGNPAIPRLATLEIPRRARPSEGEESLNLSRHPALVTRETRYFPAGALAFVGALNRATYFRASSLLSVRFLKRYSKTNRASENIVRHSSSDSPCKPALNGPYSLSKGLWPPGFK